jgi:hypothetical protein
MDQLFELNFNPYLAWNPAPFVSYNVLLIITLVLYIIDEILCYENNKLIRKLSFVKFVLIEPIVDESVFRSTVLSILSMYPGYKQISSIIYGLVKLSSLNIIKYSLSYHVSKFIFNVVFGYYLIHVNDVMTAIQLHMIYNFIIYLSVTIYQSHHPRLIDTSDDDMSDDTSSYDNDILQKLESTDEESVDCQPIDGIPVNGLLNDESVDCQPVDCEQIECESTHDEPNDNKNTLRMNDDNKLYFAKVPLLKKSNSLNDLQNTTLQQDKEYYDYRAIRSCRIPENIRLSIDKI